ncbi:P-loop containing nucleoside triphosphate hydrolase protein [Ochromonadaceae sp. CCMP2298]|nr:P-loop containing nucleoside triphosphate hydrolase protein [Ochromonadaceae sp. CCMP2298]
MKTLYICAHSNHTRIYTCTCTCPLIPVHTPAHTPIYTPSISPSIPPPTYHYPPSYQIWSVAKHDRVPRCIEQADRCFRHWDWGQRQIQGQGVAGVYEGGKGCAEEEGGVVELGEDESLLDPDGNGPLKTYTLVTCSGSGGSRGKKLPLRLSKREREVNLAVGTVLLLGRSGTGKTVCLCNRMTSDRQAKTSQLFVCRSRMLRDSVQTSQKEEGNLEEDSGGGGGEGVQSRSPESAFLTVDDFLRELESRVLGAADMHACADTGTDAGAGADTGAGTTVAAGSGSGRGRARFLRSNRVDYRRFQQLFSEFGRPKPDPLVAWTQIRSFIKGSVEALLGEGDWEGVAGSSINSRTSSSGVRALSESAYLALSNKRCRLQSSDQKEAYAVYLLYEAALRSKGLWDDCDRVMRILTTGLDLIAGKRGWDGSDRGGGGCGFPAFDKVYVDEVQDSSQIEIALYFLAAGMRYDRLFLAGDPAQSIVEGIEFRFEEVNSLVYALSAALSKDASRVSIPKLVTLNTNYRCHRRILNCASGVLHLLLTTFPHAANKLPRDEGLCGGPGPEYLSDTGAGAGAGPGAGAGAYLRRLLLDNPLFVVLCRDEQFLSEGEGGDQGGQGGQEERLGPELRRFVPELTLALGIRASKGMEFSDVLLLNFFCDLPAAEQRAWKLRLIDGHTHDAQPQMETQLKLLYTAITRSRDRFIFAETRSSAAGDAFFRWLDREKLAERMVQREGAGRAEGQGGEGLYRSNDEWRALGIQLAMSNGGIPALRIAAEYFQRAGDKAQNLLERVLLQEQVERAREGFSSALGDAETLTPTHESELADVVLRCVALQLYQDALHLCELLLPHLPGPSQALLRERVVGELQVFTS